MLEKRFYTKPFIKYLEFKRKQPLVYTDTDKCVKDLCYYPLQVFKHLNNHYDESQYKDFKSTLWTQMHDFHVAQKKQL